MYVDSKKKIIACLLIGLLLGSVFTFMVSSSSPPHKPEENNPAPKPKPKPPVHNQEAGGLEVDDGFGNKYFILETILGMSDTTLKAYTSTRGVFLKALDYIASQRCSGFLSTKITKR